MFATDTLVRVKLQCDAFYLIETWDYFILIVLVFVFVPFSWVYFIMVCFSEFEALRNNLHLRYGPRGILVPQLPPKKSFSSLIGLSTQTQDPFVKERTQGLSLFCEAIVANPFLRFDNQWKTFMRTQVGDAVDSADNGENVGERMSLAALEHLEVPYKFTLQQRISDLKEESVLIEKQGMCLCECRIFNNICCKCDVCRVVYCFLVFPL